MKRTQAMAIGRLAGLAVGLGIGAALAASPGVASADDVQVSIDGLDLLPTAGNSAIAESGMGDMAIAFGDDSFACAGCVDSPGLFDFAFANGTGSAADSGFGYLDDAFASGTKSLADSGAGNFDTAIANGANSFANASGIPNTVLGNFDFADAFGANTNAEAGNILTALPSSNDIALVLDPFGTLGGTALAGDGNFDLAAVLAADGLTSTALGNGMFDVMPALFDWMGLIG